MWSHGYWPKDQQDTILEALRAHFGGELPDWALAADLVYHADMASHPSNPVPFPGRRVLEHRWSVTQRQARKALASRGWQDKVVSAKMPLPTRHLRAPVESPHAPVCVPRVDPLPYPSRTDERPASAENVPVTVPRVDPSMSTRADVLDLPVLPTASRTTTEEVSDFEQAADYWADVVCPALGRTKRPLITRTNPAGLQLRKCLKHGLPVVMAAMHYVATGTSGRAPFLRGEVPDGQGNVFRMSLETLARHVAVYAELDEAETSTPKPRARGEHPSQRRPEPTIEQLLAMDPDLYAPLYAEAK
jgi:hypothetical protein